MFSRATSAAALGAAGLIQSGTLLAQNASASLPTASELEQITIYGQSAPTAQAAIGGSSVDQQTMQQFNRNTADAALLLVPGVTVSEVGARNETDVWVRGFDRWRVPLYQDGIPIYLPVDNRIDFGRFTTMDLAQIQVNRGFASVIDGPGALGGSINLVSRTVQRPFEGDAHVQAGFDSSGAYNGLITDLFAGTHQGNWFAQAAGSFDRQTHFRLSDSFSPGTLQGAGDRIDSFHQDYKLNLKAGYQSEAAQYTLNYIDQVGKKDNPPLDTVIPTASLKSVKYWTWPSWDKRSLYWLSQNTIDERGSFVKTRLYYDKFFNQLYSYDSLSFTTQNTPKSFDSTYDDRAIGGSAEIDELLAGGRDTVRASLHYRWDEHRETESTRNIPNGIWYQQPWESATEDTGSFALENVFRPTATWELIAGGSYDWRHLIGDSQWVSGSNAPPFGYSFAYPVADKHALNGELAAVYHYRDTGSVRLSYADRARFPTLFEMYSTRFGTFINNPDLQPERSHYAQAGVTDTVAGIQASADVFFARIDRAITAVAISPTVSENENTGAELREGYELDLSRALVPTLTAGVNYSHLARVVLEGGAVPTDTPANKFFGYLAWQPFAQLTITPSVNAEGSRWLQNAVNNTVYYRGGQFAVLDLKIQYQPLPALQLEAGGTNLTDRNYEIEDGYHAPGRAYYVGARLSL